MHASLDCHTMNDCTVIIVSWNCKAYLVDCLRSMAAMNSKVDYETVVVDNHSSDGTVEMLRDLFPKVHLIANDENLGFAAGNNRALDSARSRYVVLLNPDTIVHSGALDAIVHFMDEHPSVWAAGPSMLNRDGSPQRTGVRFPNNWNIFCDALFLDRLFPRSKLFGRHKELFVDATVPREVDYVQGACIIVRREAIEKVGLLDEKFFMYFEETDWCFRMRLAGGRVYVCPAAQVTHFGGGEVGHYDARRLDHYHRSLLRFYRKHYAWHASIVVRILLAKRSCVRILVWGMIAVGKPALRSSALSSLRGYIRSFAILIERTT
jgi:GT2 family glycosyltransferase